jgi:hypothetical protein
VRVRARACLGGTLIGDDTGFEKGGSRSAGVQRQYTGTAGKITNCQLGVFLAYAGPKGRALVDRELYLLQCWTGDEQRLAAAGVPEATGFRTKPQLLELLIRRSISRPSELAFLPLPHAAPDPAQPPRDGRGDQVDGRPGWTITRSGATKAGTQRARRCHYQYQ